MSIWEIKSILTVRQQTVSVKISGFVYPFENKKSGYMGVDTILNLLI